MLIPTPTSGDLSLYVHLPFCQKKCDYCHFFVLPNQKRYKEMLLKALLLEIELYCEAFKGKTIPSLYFGGGTPSLVGPDYLSKIIDAFSQYVNLQQAEITLELNPEDHDLEELRAYRKLGVNRLSIGVQSFDPFLLQKLGRTHSTQDSKSAVEQAHHAGFENLSIDLMYELPYQSLSSWQETLEQANQLPITHISLYNLSIEPHTTFYKYRKKIKPKMPNEKIALKMYEKALSILQASNWHPYEISALAKNDAYSRHNVGYWLQRNHLGFGPSAFSLMNGVRQQNVKNLKAYSEQVAQKIKPIDFSEELSQEAFLRESLCLQLRLYQGVDPIVFQKRFGVFPQELKKSLEHLEKQRLLLMNSDHIVLTPLGRLYHDEIAAQLVL